MCGSVFRCVRLSNKHIPSFLIFSTNHCSVDMDQIISLYLVAMKLETYRLFRAVQVIVNIYDTRFANITVEDADPTCASMMNKWVEASHASSVNKWGILDVQTVTLKHVGAWVRTKLATTSRSSQVKKTPYIRISIVGEILRSMLWQRLSAAQWSDQSTRGVSMPRYVSRSASTASRQDIYT